MAQIDRLRRAFDTARTLGPPAHQVKDNWPLLAASSQIVIQRMTATLITKDEKHTEGCEFER
jgi:hypothetical protein